VVTINRRENALVLAARAAVQMGSASLETVVMDGEMLAFAGQSFDGVLCQFGGMPFSDVPDSLQQLFRVLKPAGKACVIALTQPERNEFVSIPLTIIRSHIPPGLLPGQTDLFRLGGRGVLEAFLARAGFRRVETYIISAPLRLPSSAECLPCFTRSWLGWTRRSARKPGGRSRLVWRTWMAPVALPPPAN
jgi:SAM-dependent methyltransferase